MYPQEHFSYHKRLFWPILCLKRIGLPCCIFTTTVTCSLQITCYQTTLLLIISALAHITLMETTCHFLLLLVGFDTLTYREELQLIPYSCGSSTTTTTRSMTVPRRWWPHQTASAQGIFFLFPQSLPCTSCVLVRVCEHVLVLKFPQSISCSLH